MKQLADQARRFLRLADRDIKTFNILKRSSDAELSSICFHAQQAVEKCLKAALLSCNIEPTRTHDLNQLTYALNEAGITLPITIEQLNLLNPYAVIFRYDDTDIEIISKDEAENIVNSIRNFVEKLILPK